MSDASASTEGKAPAPRALPRVLRFDDFRVDTLRRELFRHDEPVELTPRVFELLLAFLERPGELLKREELIERVWPGRYIEDANLTQGVFVLRKALAAGEQEYKAIITEPGAGYRFVRSVEAEAAPPERDTGEPDEAAQAVPVAGSAEGPDSARRSPSLRAWLGGAGAALVVVLLVVLALRLPGDPERPVPVTLSSVETLAVMPFIELATNEPSPMGLGLSDTVITRIGTSGRFVVRPLPTVLDYYRPGELPQELGRRLRVDAVLVGSLLRSEGELRASAQLVETVGGRTLWAEAFATPEAEPFELQEAVAAAVSKALLPTESERALPTAGTESYAAYEKLMLGRFWLAERSAEGLRKARTAFGEAAELDPGYGAAWAGIADTDFLLGFYGLGDLPPSERYELARLHAQRALEIDAELAAPLTVLGMYHVEVERDLAAAEEVFGRALAVAARSARTHHWNAWRLLTAGRVDEAVRSIERARELDPLSLIVRSAQGRMAYYRGEWQEAVEHLDQALEIRDDFGRGHLNRGLALEQLGRSAEAAAALLRAREILGPTGEVQAAQAHLAFCVGEVDRWRELVDELESRPSGAGDLAIALAPARPEESLAALERALVESSIWSWYRFEPRLEPLHRLPRFQEISALDSGPR